MDKATDTKADTDLKCIDLPHNSIIDGDGLSEFSSNDCGSLDATGGTQFHKSTMRNSVTASAKQPRGLFCEFLHSPSGSAPWREEANGDVQ